MMVPVYDRRYNRGNWTVLRWVISRLTSRDCRVADARRQRRDNQLITDQGPVYGSFEKVIITNLGTWTPRKQLVEVHPTGILPGCQAPEVSIRSSDARQCKL